MCLNTSSLHFLGTPGTPFEYQWYGLKQSVQIITGPSFYYEYTPSPLHDVSTTYVTCHKRWSTCLQVTPSTSSLQQSIIFHLPHWPLPHQWSRCPVWRQRCSSWRAGTRSRAGHLCRGPRVRSAAGSSAPGSHTAPAPDASATGGRSLTGHPHAGNGPPGRDREGHTPENHVTQLGVKLLICVKMYQSFAKSLTWIIGLNDIVKSI